eukprot:18658-Heterococcus_DN1.PRE.1
MLNHAALNDSLDTEHTASQQRIAALSAEVTALQTAAESAATVQRLATAGVSPAAIQTLREATALQMHLMHSLPDVTVQRTLGGLPVFLPGNGHVQLAAVAVECFHSRIGLYSRVRYCSIC